ncbi:MAG: DUF547 domain-containing protein [Pedosphaera sp.]|nr:DUF547 domain-containing protein [Pedosphaera sp.]MST00919.1 DUF547 domain-containing protein [Pedosphaera sp.]
MNPVAFTTLSLAFLLLSQGCSENSTKAPAAVPFDHQQQTFARVLKAVVRNGQVDYTLLRRQRDELETALDAAAAVSRDAFAGWTPNQQLSFLLNVYNAQILALLADHPEAKSIKDLGGLRPVWNLPTARLFGKKWSLDELEHEFIRKQFKNPSVHFALVCGAKGCPPLRTEPYSAAELETQFQEQARQFLGDTLKNQVDVKKRVVHLSPLFKWYREDFGKSDAQLLEFVARHLPPELAAELGKGGFTIEYTDYDWSVNQAAPTAKP